MAEFVRPRAPEFYDPTTPPWLDTEQGILHLFDDPTIRWVLEDRSGLFSRNPRGSLPPDTDYHPTLDFMWFEDNPRHGVLRRLAARWFTPAALADLEGVIQNHAHSLLKRHALPDGRLDLARYSYGLALLATSSLMGYPMEHENVLDKELERVAHAQNLFTLPPDPAAAAVYWETIAERLIHPQDELLDALINAWVKGKITKRELVAFMFGFLGAGRDTTGAALADAMVVLTLENKLDWFAAQRDNPAALKTACHELIRYTSTSFPDHPAPRTTRPWEVHGIEVPVGTRAVLHLSAANFDEAINGGKADAAPPTVLDLTRDPNKYLGFGGGAHFCLGWNMAPMVMRIGLIALIEAGYRFDRRPLKRVSGLTDGLVEAYCIRR